MSNSTGDKLNSINANQVVKVSHDQLLFSCPLPGQTLCNSHPQVYLSLKKNGQQAYPYCGTVINSSHDLERVRQQSITQRREAILFRVESR